MKFIYIFGGVIALCVVYLLYTFLYKSNTKSNTKITRPDKIIDSNIKNTQDILNFINKEDKKEKEPLVNNEVPTQPKIDKSSEDVTKDHAASNASNASKAPEPDNKSSTEEPINNEKPNNPKSNDEN